MWKLAGNQKPSTFVISITPFDKKLRLDEKAFRGHLRRLAKSGIGVYVGGGGSGEAYSYVGDERRRVLEIAVEELKGKVPVRAMGVEPRTAREMVEFVKMTKEVGVDATQIYSLDVGHGNAPSNDEMDAYFSEVLESSNAPVVLSTHQSVGYKVSTKLVIDLAKRYKHLIGINCTHSDLGYLAEIIDGVGHRIPVHVGGPMQGLTVLSLGGHGYLSSEGNLAPNLCVSVIDRFAAGDMDGMMERFGKLIRLFAGLYGNGGIRATKAVLNHLGLPGGYPRKPRLPASDEAVKRAIRVVEELGIGKIEKWK